MKSKIQKVSHDHESQSSSSAAAQIVASVDDLLIEILFRVPIKSLIRFKSVSKHWQSLISDPGFSILCNPNPNPASGLILQVPIRSQPRSHSDPYAYIVSLDSSSPRLRTLKFINPCRPIQSSCNGLILMCGIYKRLPTCVFEYYVCNPTTNKYLKLPQIPDKPDWMPSPMCLAFDPSKSPRYKVVCVRKVPGQFDTPTIFWRHFMVYSSETGCWRKSCVEPFQVANVDFHRGVYWNGAMHWVSKEKTGKSIYFDPDDDQMSLEIMPTPPRVERENYYFGESCGHLHFVDNSWNWSFDVYELRNDYSEWFVKYRIHRHDPSSYDGLKMPYLCAVVRGKSHDDDSFSVLVIEGKLVRYIFANKTCENIFQVQGTPLEKFAPRGILPFQHNESLCSV